MRAVRGFENGKGMPKVYQNQQRRANLGPWDGQVVRSKLKNLSVRKDGLLWLRDLSQ